MNSCDQIFQVGDRIIRINGTPVVKEKPSILKKLLKPNKQGVMTLEIERIISQPIMHSPMPVYSPQRSLRSASFSSSDAKMVSPPTTISQGATESQMHNNATQGLTITSQDLLQATKPTFPSNYPPTRSFTLPSHHHYDPRQRHTSTGSNSSGGDVPTKQLVSIVTSQRSRNPISPQRQKHSRYLEGPYNERRIEFREFIESETTQDEAMHYSATGSEYSQEGYEFSSSSQSIHLSFNEFTNGENYNPLTVATLPTQDPAIDDDHFARQDGERHTVRTVSYTHLTLPTKA